MPFDSACPRIPDIAACNVIVIIWMMHPIFPLIHRASADVAQDKF
jgi:hypothetical protein